MPKYNILEGDNLERLNAFMEYYDVPSADQQVPILFYRDGYLSGQKAILENAAKILRENPNGDPAWLEEMQEWTDSYQEPEDPEWNFRQILAFLGMGFVNGLNPCAASMLLMLLTILLMNGRNFLKGGLTYMAAKILAYTMMGMGFFQVLNAAQGSRFQAVQSVLTLVFALLALILCILNLWDYRNVKRQEYGKVLVQLPKGLRGFNHRMIEGVKKVPPVLLLPAVFLLGFIISAGEFFCTGQLYVAAIYSMFRAGEKSALSVWLMLLLYVIAMCIPQLIIIFVIEKSRNVSLVSGFTLQKMPVIKLIYAVMFFLVFLFLVFSR